MLQRMGHMDCALLGMQVMAVAVAVALASAVGCCTQAAAVPEMLCAVVVAVGSLRGAVVPVAECTGPPPLYAVRTEA